GRETHSAGWAQVAAADRTAGNRAEVPGRPAGVIDRHVSARYDFIARHELDERRSDSGRVVEGRPFTARHIIERVDGFSCRRTAVERADGRRACAGAFE